jgi:hypothetical protein
VGEAPLRGPIIVAGMPRSGTTLLSAMLSAHSEIAIAPETHFLTTWANRYPDPGDPDIERLKAFWDAYTEGERFASLGLDAARVWRRIEQSRRPDLRAAFTALLAGYADFCGKSIFGEKTPGNEHRLGLVFGWYPEAKAVYIVRDPRAVVASLMRMPWSHRAPGIHARRWQVSVDAVSSWRDDGRVHVLRYEDLIRAPEAELEALCDFLEVGFEPDMLENYGQQAGPLIAGRPWKEEVRRPLNEAALERWRGHLPVTEVALIEHVARTGMQRFGYETSGHKVDPPCWVRYHVRRGLRFLMRRFKRRTSSISGLESHRERQG